MNEKLRDFDVLDEVHGDDDDDDEADDQDGANGRRETDASAMYDDSSDTDLETDSGLTLARRVDSRRSARTAVVSNNDVNGQPDAVVVKCEPSSLDGGDTNSSGSASVTTAAMLNGGDGGGDEDVELADDELEALLNEGLPENMRIEKKHESQYDEKFKTVLVELEQNHFDVLPEGWVQVWQSGDDVQMERPSCIGFLYFSHESHMILMFYEIDLLSRLSCFPSCFLFLFGSTSYATM